MRNFDEIWRTASKIEGWFDRIEAHALYEELVGLPYSANIVELGCYLGRSSFVIGCMAREKDFNFVTVDDFSSPGTSEEKFRLNMRQGNQASYHLEKCKSDEYFNKLQRVDQFIDLIFFDTVHTYEHVKHDLDLWLPLVKPGGIVLVHDFSDKYVGVKKAIEERNEFGAKGLAFSLFIGSKK